MLGMRDQLNRWIRDLTRECIEPNPGPRTFDEIQAAMTLSAIHVGRGQATEWLASLRAQYASWTVVINAITRSMHTTQHTDRTLYHQQWSDRNKAYNQRNQCEQLIIGLLGAGAKKGDGPWYAKPTLVESAYGQPDYEVLKKAKIEYAERLGFGDTAFDRQVNRRFERYVFNQVRLRFIGANSTAEVAPPAQYSCNMSSSSTSSKSRQAKVVAKPQRDQVAQLFSRLSALEKQTKKPVAPAVIKRAAQQALPKSAARAVIQGRPLITATQKREVSKAITGYEHLHSAGTPHQSHDGKVLHHGAFTTSQRGSITVARGTERIGACGTGAALVAGQVVTSTLLNPLVIGARLPLMAPNFAKWRLKRGRLHYLAQINPSNTTAAGTVIITVQPDPLAPNVPATDEGVTLLYAWPSSAETSIYRSTEKNIVIQNDAQFLYVQLSGDERFLYAGIATAYAGSAIQAGAGAFGQFFIEYEIEFDEPIVNQPPNMYVAGYAGNFNPVTTGNSPIAWSLDGTTPAGVLTAFGASGTTGVVGNGHTIIPGTTQGFIGNTDFFTIASATTSFGVFPTIFLLPGTYFIEMFGLIFSGAGTFAGPLQVLTVNNSTTFGQTTERTYETASIANAFGNIYNSTLYNVATTTPAISWAGYCAVTGAAAQPLIFLFPAVSATCSASASVRICAVNPQGGSFPGGLIGCNPKIRQAMLKYQQQQDEEESTIQGKFDALIDALEAKETLTGEEYVLLMAVSGHKGPAVTPMILPAIAAAVTWFVSTYGAQLGKAAVDWGVRKLEKWFARGKRQEETSIDCEAAEVSEIAQRYVDEYNTLDCEVVDAELTRLGDLDALAKRGERLRGLSQNPATQTRVATRERPTARAATPAP